MRSAATLFGALLALAGTVFFLQGIGLLHGSTMTGETTWAIIGPILAAVGVALISVGQRRT
jgi:drug/metabolite transporter superfamily protein YnfA